MRAVVLMCLLHAALGSWPLSHTRDPNPRPGGECGTSKASCSCCVMVKELDRMRTYFNTTLNKLEEEYLQIEQSLDKIEDSYTAFSAALHDEFKCIGPFTEDATIIYEHVFLNLGDAYSEETGIVTVSHSGVYSVTVTIYSDAGAPGITLVACATVLVNGRMVVGSREINSQDQEDSVTIAVALHLKAGDELVVNLPKGCFLCDGGNHYNTFSVFLLYLE